jgi:Lrp/AsnC family transcriptional regulator
MYLGLMIWPMLIDVTSSFAMEKIKYTTALPIPE